MLHARLLHKERLVDEYNNSIVNFFFVGRSYLPKVIDEQSFQHKYCIHVI